MLRVTTGMIYDQGVSSIQRQTGQLLHTQQMVSTGRRILTPADDPVAAARALEVTQAKSVNDQFQVNQGTATDALGLTENKLTAVGDLITAVRTRAVEAGNGAYSAAELQDIATDLRGQFDALMALANSQDGNGEYLFAGYKGNTQPFTGSVGGGVAYQGDQGERSIQVSASRIVPVSNSGDDVFMTVPGINNRFTSTAATGNTGQAIIDGGQVTSYDGTSAFSVSFAASGSGYTYTVDTVPASATPVTTGSYVSGQPIVINDGAGNDISVTISGTPAAGDSFSIDPVPASAQAEAGSVFQVMDRLISALEAGTQGNAFRTELAQSITGLDKSLDNILRVRASLGSRMNEVDALKNVGSDLSVQYAQTLSNLQDVDYAQAVTDLTLKQTYLQAAQQSFLRVSQLSLFNYLGS